MADPVGARASGEPSGEPTDPSSESVPIQQLLMEIAEELKDNGDFNERAYIAMCNVAKEAHHMRDTAMKKMNDQLMDFDQQITFYKTHTENLSNVAVGYKTSLEKCQRTVDLYKEKVKALEEKHKIELELQSRVFAVKKLAKEHLAGIGKAPTRQLRSGRRF